MLIFTGYFFQFSKQCLLIDSTVMHFNQYNRDLMLIRTNSHKGGPEHRRMFIEQRLAADCIHGAGLGNYPVPIASTKP